MPAIPTPADNASAALDIIGELQNNLNLPVSFPMDAMKSGILLILLAKENPTLEGPELADLYVAKIYNLPNQKNIEPE